MSTKPENSSVAQEQRKKLEKLVSSETLDELMQVVGSKGWISIWCCFAIILIGIIWSFIGSIPIKVIGNGISMTASGPHIVVNKVEGTVIGMCVSSGEYVEKDDLLVRLENPTLALQIRQQEGTLANKQAQLQELTSRVDTEKRALRDTLLKEIESTLLAQKTTESEISFLEKDLASKERLEAKGIIPAPAVQEARAKLEQAHIDIETYKAKLSRLKADMERSYRVEEIQAKLDEVGAARSELERLRLESSYLDIRADRSGKVLEVIVSGGQLLMPGAEAVSIEIPVSKGEYLHYYACFGAEYGDMLDVGLPVEIEVSGVDPKMYGFLLGKTRFVSPYPVTMEELKSDVRNTEIANYLKGGDPIVYSAIIELTVDPRTKSGYAWSTKSGPPWRLSSGTVGTVKTIVERKPPIIYILPVEVSPYFYKLLKHE